MNSTDSAGIDEESDYLTVAVSEWLTILGAHVSRWIIIFTGELILYGVYCMIAFLALYTIGKRRNWTVKALFLSAALLVTFCVVTTTLCIDMWGVYTMLNTIFLDETETLLKGRIKAYNARIVASDLEAVQLWLVGNADTGLVFIIADALACWRAIAIWGPVGRARRLLAVTLSFLLFVSFALWLTQAAINTSPYGNPEDDASWEYITWISRILRWTSSSASITANMMATGMIGYAAYGYLQASPNRVGKGARVLVNIAESAVIYVIIQIVRLSLDISKAYEVSSESRYVSLDTAARVFHRTTAVLTAMYPAILILIIHYGYFLPDNVQYSSVGEVHSPNGGIQAVSAIEFEDKLATSTGLSSQDRTNYSGGLSTTAKDGALDYDYRLDEVSRGV